MSKVWRQTTVASKIRPRTRLKTGNNWATYITTNIIQYTIKNTFSCIFYINIVLCVLNVSFQSLCFSFLCFYLYIKCEHGVCMAKLKENRCLITWKHLKCIYFEKETDSKCFFFALLKEQKLLFDLVLILWKNVPDRLDR